MPDSLECQIPWERGIPETAEPKSRNMKFEFEFELPGEVEAYSPSASPDSSTGGVKNGLLLSVTENRRIINGTSSQVTSKL